jgi:hypothetical protein
MDRVTEKMNYPQFAGPSAESAAAGGGVLDALRFSPAVQNRPAGIESVERTPNGVLLTLGVSGRKSVLSYTHETAIRLYRPAAPTEDKLYLRVELWADDIFRVVFSPRRDVKDPCAGLPKELRMLVAEQEKVDFTFEDGVLATRRMRVCIGGDARLSAETPDGEEFFSQCRTEFQAADVFDLAVSRNGEDFACFEALELENDELIYGLGERFDSIVRNVRQIDDEYLFGDGLLIAPVLKPLRKSRERRLYLPEGVWFDYFTRERIVSAGEWRRRPVDLRTLPIYVKEGTTLRYCSADTTLRDGMGEIVKTEVWR